MTAPQAVILNLVKLGLSRQKIDFGLTKLHYLKLTICTLFLLLVVSISSLQAQDYMISFSGSGESNTVTTVIVKNLTQGTSLTMDGSKVLHLIGNATGIESTMNITKNEISFSPNPMKEYTIMQFVLSESGETIISLHDLSGRQIMQKQDLLLKGQHTYRIEGIKNGIYIVTIRSDRYSASCRLICSGSQTGKGKIVYESTAISKKDINNSKGDEAVEMGYGSEDLLYIIGISLDYTTIVTEVITADKIINFNFVSCTDGDGNNYPVVKVGTQTWMAENLRTTKYLNTELIGTTTPATLDISGESSPKYQWPYDGNESNKYVYGILYSHYVVTDNRSLCPAGWHVPSDTEWTTLTDYLGGETFAYLKLKETGNTHWIAGTSIQTATNESGCTALPGGYRNAQFGFMAIQRTGSWWSGTEHSTSEAWYRSLDFNTDYVIRDYMGHTKKDGLSIRCIKD